MRPDAAFVQSHSQGSAEARGVAALRNEVGQRRLRQHGLEECSRGRDVLNNRRLQIGKRDAT